MEETKQFKIFAGSKGEALAKRVCDELGCQLGNVRIDRLSLLRRRALRLF